MRGFGVPGGERVDRRLWRRKGDKRVAAVEKIEDQRKPEDFFGYRNRITPYGGTDCHVAADASSSQ